VQVDRPACTWLGPNNARPPVRRSTNSTIIWIASRAWRSLRTAIAWRPAAPTQPSWSGTLPIFADEAVFTDREPRLLCIGVAQFFNRCESRCWRPTEEDESDGTGATSSSIHRAFRTSSAGPSRRRRGALPGWWVSPAQACRWEITAKFLSFRPLSPW